MAMPVPLEVFHNVVRSWRNIASLIDLLRPPFGPTRAEACEGDYAVSRGRILEDWWSSMLGRGLRHICVSGISFDYPTATRREPPLVHTTRLHLRTRLLRVHVLDCYSWLVVNPGASSRKDWCHAAPGW
jgi:hypothetical protein